MLNRLISSKIIRSTPRGSAKFFSENLALNFSKRRLTNWFSHKTCFFLVNTQREDFWGNLTIKKDVHEDQFRVSFSKENEIWSWLVRSWTKYVSMNYQNFFRDQKWSCDKFQSSQRWRLKPHLKSIYLSTPSKDVT